MESDLFDLDEALSAKIYLINSMIIRADEPDSLSNYIPGAKDFHPDFRPYLYGQ